MPCHLDHGTSVFHLYKCDYCEKHSPTVYTGGLHVGYKHWDKKETFDKFVQRRKEAYYSCRHGNNIESSSKDLR